jgi:hypothetical protein
MLSLPKPPAKRCEPQFEEHCPNYVIPNFNASRQSVHVIMDSVTGCLQAILRDLFSAVLETWEFECKADLAYTSVTQFHILAINQSVRTPHEPQLIIPTSPEL